MGRTRTGSYTETFDKSGRHIGWKFTMPVSELDGKKVSGNGKTKKDAREKQAANVKKKLQKLGLTDINTDYEKLTFKELCRLFLAHKELEVKESTFHGYTMADKYLFPKLYALRVNKITAAMIDGALTELQQEKGLLSSSLALYKRQLAAVFNYAIKQEIIYTSPMLKTAKRRKETSRRVDIAVLTEAQIKELLHRAKEEDKTNNKRRKVKVYPLLLLALATGCRRGELLAIKHENIKEGWLTIKEQVTPKNNIAAPKTDSSYRTLPLPPDVLEKVLSCFPHADRSGGSYLLSYADGSRYTYGTSKGATERFFARCRDIIPANFAFHDLRHTYATQLLGKRINLRTVSSWLGHSDISITLQFYINYMPEDEDKATGILSDLLL